jgi:hypothetical protein
MQNIDFIFEHLSSLKLVGIGKTLHLLIQPFKQHRKDFLAGFF